LHFSKSDGLFVITKITFCIISGQRPQILTLQKWIQPMYNSDYYVHFFILFLTTKRSVPKLEVIVKHVCNINGYACPQSVHIRLSLIIN